jgi:hypothetical protein
VKAGALPSPDRAVPDCPDGQTEGLDEIGTNLRNFFAKVMKVSGSGKISGIWGIPEICRFHSDYAIFKELIGHAMGGTL